MLHQIAALLSEQGVAFKPAAYRRAAQVIEDLPKDISTYGDEKELKKLPGIGDAIAKKIIEYLETGKMSFLEQLRAELGGLSAELMDIENMGPKRARQFQVELGISTVPELIKAAEAGKLRSLPRMSEDMEKKILESAKRVKERTKRFKREEITEDVEELKKAIASVEGVEQCEVAGSYRRKKPTVGDIDILVITNNPQKISDSIVTLRRAQGDKKGAQGDKKNSKGDSLVRDIVAHGDTKVSFDLHNGLRVDVRLVQKNQWGSALLYFTGSKEHNIAMRKVAISKGWKLNEYGLFDGETVLASKTEEDIYEALGLKFYEPSEREGGL